MKKVIFSLLLILGSFTYCFGASCPSGYHSDGNYCMPNNSNSKPIFQKLGSCPSGWHSDGNYCAANSLTSKPIMQKKGSCPSSWHSDGNYCVKN